MTTPPPEPPAEGPAASDPPPAEASPYGGPPPAYEQAPAPGYSSTPPPYPAATPGAPVPGGLLDRFLARLIDSILVGIVNFIVASVIIAGAIMGSSATGFGTGSSYAAGAVVAIIGTAISLGYFALMEHTRGQTVGKMILKLQTIGPGGGNPTLEEAVKRNSYILLGLLGLIPLIGWIASLASLAAIIMIAVTINSDTVNRQGWHDNFAGGTQVLKIG